MNHYENIQFSVKNLVDLYKDNLGWSVDDDFVIPEHNPDCGCSEDDFFAQEVPYSEKYNYDAIMEYFAGVVGGEVVLQVDDNDYQGDSRVLFRSKDGFFGLLFFGWGSCSGCDWLQGCSSWKELQELFNSMWKDIVWYENAQGCLDYINQKDWDLDSAFHRSETKEFLDKAVEELEKAAEEQAKKCAGAVQQFQEESEEALFLGKN